MNRRSRKGCIDCKKSKIKCDELYPHCGTCLRRGYACQGYPDLAGVGSPILKSNVAEHRASKRHERRGSDNRRLTSHRTIATSELQDSFGSDSDTEQKRDRRMKPKTNDTKAMLPYPPSNRKEIEVANRTSICARIPSIPYGTIHSADEPIIEIYFLRHPSELVISAEFVDEMNANVLKVFHEDPKGVCDSLSAIGYLYMEGGQTLVPVLDRKAKIFARLKDRTELEQMLVMLLGLSALELIDGTSTPSESALPAIVANAALIIQHTESTRGNISSVAQYFIRALARQDMMLSLAQSRRPLISCSAWLGEDCSRHADRFMGYTGPLMPLLSELSTLAEDVRSQAFFAIEQPLALHNTDELGDEMMLLANESTNLFQRAIDLQSRIEQWRPLPTQNVSFKSSRNLLFHAYAHKAAAVLHLHRILNPPGSSEEADIIALGMAHEVLMHLSAMSDQLKTALWPVLVAGSELTEEEDRKTVLKMFDKIHRQRRTVTSLRTRNFCVHRVWKARDDGLSWNWMDLVYQYPGECVPI